MCVCVTVIKAVGESDPRSCLDTVLLAWNYKSPSDNPNSQLACGVVSLENARRHLENTCPEGAANPFNNVLLASIYAVHTQLATLTTDKEGREMDHNCTDMAMLLRRIH